VTGRGILKNILGVFKMVNRHYNIGIKVSKNLDEYGKALALKMNKRQVRKFCNAITGRAIQKYALLFKEMSSVRDNPKIMEKFLFHPEQLVLLDRFRQQEDGIGDHHDKDFRATVATHPRSNAGHIGLEFGEQLTDATGQKIATIVEGDSTEGLPSRETSAIDELIVPNHGEEHDPTQSSDAKVDSITTATVPGVSTSHI